MTEQTPTWVPTTQAEPCNFGRKTENPCPHPAAWRRGGELPMCEGHKVLCDKVANRVDAIRTSLYYLSRWIRVAQRHRLYRLATMLGQHRVALKAELEDLKTREQEIVGRYSMDTGPYTLSEEESYERHWLAEAGRRGDRFKATIVALEEELDDLYIRMQELVLPPLMAEREKAYAEHKRHQGRDEA